MESPTSLATDNSQPHRKGGVCSKGIPAADSDERPHRGPWPSEAPPTGVLTGVLGELAFYYGACWLYHRSTPPSRGKLR